MSKHVFIFLFSFSCLFAEDITISTAVTGQQGLDGSNSTLTVTTSGSVTNSTGGEACIKMNDAASAGVSGQIVTNNGSLTATGAEGAGIFNGATGGTSATIVNNGTIRTEGTGLAIGINNAASGATITNNGTITTIGDGGVASGSPGILSQGTASSSTVYNFGTISTSGDTECHGMEVDGNTSTVTNAGTISTSGNGSCYGIYSDTDGDFSTFINSGSITTSGTTGHGIRIEGSGVSVTNNGSIHVSGTGSDGFSSTGANVVLTNSGTIKSNSSYALNFTGTNPTLSLKRGSILDGAVNSDNALNLTVERGLNLRLTIEETNGFGAINIPMPYVKIGNTETIACVDQTSFAMQSDILEDLSDSILDIVYRNQYAFLNCCFPCKGTWLAGMYSYRERDRCIETYDWQAGFLTGAYCQQCRRQSTGLFAGASWGEGKVQGNTATAETASYFGGLTYEQLFCGTFFAGALSAGYFQSNNRRTVAYNLAPNGIEAAKAHAKGGMLTAELYAARWFTRSTCIRPLLTAAIRYAGLYLGSYNENGSSADLFVKNRNISLLKPKLDLNFIREGCLYDFNYLLQPYIGVAGRFQVGGNRVTSTLLNLPLNFDSDAPKGLAELLYGIYGTLTNDRPLSLFYHFQGLRDSAQSSRFLTEAGISYVY